MAVKRHTSLRDKLTSAFLLLIILGMLIGGAIVLIWSGVFAPVAAPQALVDTEPLNLPTKPPKRAGEVPAEATAEPETAAPTETP